MIIELYIKRNEDAISACEKKYGAELKSISFRITGSHEDANECLNDALLQAWRSVPENPPDNLHSYLVRIVRNLSIDRVRKSTSKKRGAAVVAFDELIECIPDENAASHLLDERELANEIKTWLIGQSAEKQAVFVRRYFLMQSVREISKTLDIKEHTLSATLTRLRASLKKHLENCGYTI